MGALPKQRPDSNRRMQIRVSKWSAIGVLKNSYSVLSRLIGSRVQVHIYVERIELW